MDRCLCVNLLAFLLTSSYKYMYISSVYVYVHKKMYRYLFIDSQTCQTTSHTKNSMPRNMLNMSSASAKLAKKTAVFSGLTNLQARETHFPEQSSLMDGRAREGALKLKALAGMGHGHLSFFDGLAGRLHS